MQEQVSDGDVLLPIGRELLSQQGGITHLHIYAQWRLNVNNKDLFLLLLLQDNSMFGSRHIKHYYPEDFICAVVIRSLR